MFDDYARGIPKMSEPETSLLLEDLYLRSGKVP